MKPVRKKNAYVAKLGGSTPTVVRLSQVRIRQVGMLDNSAGTVFTFSIAGSAGALGSHGPAVDFIGGIDDAALATSLENNKIWFNNDLGHEDLIPMFRRSVAEDCVSALASKTLRPRHISINGKVYSGPMGPGILEAAGGSLMGWWANVVLEAHGLYFYQKRFGIRWIVRELEMVKEDPRILDMRAVSEDAGASRREIEASWTEELAKFKDRHAKAEALLNLAKSRDTPDMEWNALLEKCNAWINFINK